MLASRADSRHPLRFDLVRAGRSALDDPRVIADTGVEHREAAVVREQRVTTPDGHVWYVRRRWARRQLPWKRRADRELSPAERETVPMMVDTDELLGPVGEFFALDAEGGLLLVLALLALAALGVLALIGVVREWVLPYLVANAGWIGAALATIAVLILLDRLTRPWFIEAESARLFHAPRRIWRVHGWWRSRRAVQAVAAAIAEGRIDNQRGVVLFTERSTARQRP